MSDRPLPAPPDGLLRWPVVIVGAGAAGMMTAIHAARTGVPVLVLESARKPGAKIKVSGGGRCNVLPSVVDEGDFHTEGSSKAVRKVLRSWPLDHVTAFFADDLGIPLKVEATGKVFPVSDRSGDVVSALLRAMDRAGVTLATDTRVADVTRGDDGFTVTTTDDRSVHADRVVLTTGGLSLPKTGSDGAGYRWARTLGHTVLPRYPALVPLLTDTGDWDRLAGLAVPARLTARAPKVVWEGEGDLLVTHKGFSGPVVLDASHRVAAPWGQDTALTARWTAADAPADWDVHLQQGGARPVVAVLRDTLPRRLADHLCGLADIDPSTTLGALRRDDRKRLVALLEECPLHVTGTEGYRTAEVTGGGVPLAELSTTTLESRLVPGLHMAGEIIDVTGRLGGYNFHWAWVTGRLAGLAAA
ncbi:aminoacetone oxidase family FAD-binding enzyme [Euzebya pacifica]|uniref:NAD(P)/FAD-dependent oxidoreductase n=1 Tax=Euzebya pacifica TaxID=1608957 RepID=UPI0030F5ADE5